jgi:hypothetical protein
MILSWPKSFSILTNVFGEIFAAIWLQHSFLYDQPSINHNFEIQYLSHSKLFEIYCDRLGRF